MKRIALTIIALSILSVTSWFLGAQFQTNTAGEVTIILVDGNTEISRNNHAFKEGDSLYDILSENYQVYCADRHYQKDETCTPVTFTELTGRILLSINSLESNWSDTFIQIHLNGVPATAGMDQLQFTDQDEISLVLKTVE
jgi:hypothetical protein